jgi:hypothetical protein
MHKVLVSTPSTKENKIFSEESALRNRNPSTPKDTATIETVSLLPIFNPALLEYSYHNYSFCIVFGFVLQWQH